MANSGKQLLKFSPVDICYQVIVEGKTWGDQVIAAMECFGDNRNLIGLAGFPQLCLGERNQYAQGFKFSLKFC